MKKKIILRSILGFPIGIAIGHLITIFISLGWANGFSAQFVATKPVQNKRGYSLKELSTILSKIKRNADRSENNFWMINAKECGMMGLRLLV